MDDEYLARERVAKIVGEGIRRWRELRGLTQAVLAERLNVEPETIGRFERGAILPPLIRLVHIAQVLQTDIEHLVADIFPDVTNESYLQMDVTALDSSDRALVDRLFVGLSDWAKSKAEVEPVSVRP